MKVRISLALLLLLVTSAMAGLADDEADIAALMTEYRDAFVAMDAHRVAAVFGEPFTLLAPPPGTVSALASTLPSWHSVAGRRCYAANSGRGSPFHSLESALP